MRRGIEALKQVQAERGLRDVHVVEFDEHGFTIAHTDYERANIDLEDCGLHRHLLEGPPDVEFEVPLVATVHQPDGYSDSYRSDPWQYDPVAD